MLDISQPNEVLRAIKPWEKRKKKEKKKHSGMRLRDGLWGVQELRPR